MKNFVLIFSFFTIIGCKKETPIQEKNTFDSITVSKIPQDSLKTPEIKQEVFTFETELCTNKALYDANKYSKEELEDTYKIWFTMGGTLLNTESVFNINSLQKVRNNNDEILSKLEKEFSEKKKIFENLKVVKDSYWQNIKKHKIKELVEEYEFKKTQIQAYSLPSVLLNNKLSKGCENFATALNSDDTTMFVEWRKLREKMSKRNADPERIINEFENMINSSNAKELAIIDLITFGWGNCVNHHLSKVEHNEEMNKKFESLFIKIDADCDEP